MLNTAITPRGIYYLLYIDFLHDLNVISSGESYVRLLVTSMIIIFLNVLTTVTVTIFTAILITIVVVNIIVVIIFFNVGDNF